jgi:hypothetical protein
MLNVFHLQPPTSYPQLILPLASESLLIMRKNHFGWAGNVSYFPREITETAALAHVIGDKAEQAYRRSDAQEKRRRLMEAWRDIANHVGQPR